MGRPRAGEQPTTEKDFEFPVVLDGALTSEA